MDSQPKNTRKTERRSFVRYELDDRLISGRVVWISADGVIRICQDDGVFVNVKTVRRLSLGDAGTKRSCGRFRKHLFRRVVVRIVDRIDDGGGEELLIAEICDDAS